MHDSHIGHTAHLNIQPWLDRKLLPCQPIKFNSLEKSTWLEEEYSRDTFVQFCGNNNNGNVHKSSDWNRTQLYVETNAINMYAKYQLHPRNGFEKKLFEYMYETLPLVPPRQPVKLSDSDRIHMKGRELLNTLLTFL